MAGTPTVALVGATGGAGTTRTCVELAALLAGDGRTVAVLDAAFATQGLADYLDGRLDPDVTSLLTDAADEPLENGLVELVDDAPGRAACCPASAPFERLARAKTAGAARDFEERIDEASEAFDVVLVDTPPVAANQAVAAVNACDRTALVTPASTRGRDAVQRMRDRLADLAADVDAVVSTRGNETAADVSLPETESEVSAAPSVATDGSYATAVARLGEKLLEADVDVPSDDGVFGSVSDYVSR
ncbi:AAA family ATPase [Haloplanus sp. GCM10025708]|uniref:AAA family ATPase n=1 Tax=Haloferacaceae TaxID=1644056 RepID=UPI003613BF13